MPATLGVGRVLNVSMTGAFMETKEPLRLMSLIYLTPAAPTLANSVLRRLAAYVVRRDGRSVGLEWCETVDNACNFLAGWVASSSDLVDAESRISALASVWSIPLNRGEFRAVGGHLDGDSQAGVA
jgi:hypothetical protein